MMQVKRFGVGFLAGIFVFFLSSARCIGGSKEKGDKCTGWPPALPKVKIKLVLATWWNRPDNLLCTTKHRKHLHLWPLMLSLVNKGLFCTVRAGKNKKTKIHPLQFPMNVIAATVRFPIFWIYKAQVTVKSMKTKTTQSRGLVVFARFFNCTSIFTPWSEVWAEQLWSRKQKYSQIWQGGFCFILCYRAANFLSGKTLGRGSFCCGFSLCAIRLDFRADWEGHLLIALVSLGHYIKRKISFNVSWDKA